MIILFD